MRNIGVARPRVAQYPHIPPEESTAATETK